MKAKLDQPLEVITNALHVKVEKEPSVIVEQDEHHQHHAHCEANFAKTTDTNFDTRDDRDGGNEGNGPDDDDLVGAVLFDVAVHSVEARVDGNHAETKTGAHTKHGDYDGKRVDHLAHPAEDPVSEKRMKTRAYCHG